MDEEKKEQREEQRGEQPQEQREERRKGRLQERQEEQPQEQLSEQDARQAEQKKNEQRVYRLLEEWDIPYGKNEHRAVFTTEEAHRYGTDLPGLKMKNLFVADKKTGKHYLVILQDMRRLDFKALKAYTGWKKPAFASEEALWEYLKLTRGAVTALGLINDPEHRVTVVLDKKIGEEPPETCINFHPCVNTATVAFSLKDFRRFLERCGNEIIVEGGDEI